MPYVIVSGNLIPLSPKNVSGSGVSPTPWKVGISGLKAFELEDLKRFTLDPQADAHTVIFKHHPITLINALEVLGYRVISSFNNGTENCVWTMRKDFPDPEPSDDEEEESSSDDIEDTD